MSSGYSVLLLYRPLPNKFRTVLTLGYPAFFKLCVYLFKSKWQLFVYNHILGLCVLCFTGRSFVVTVTLDIMRNTLQRENINYVNFIWLLIGMHLEKSNNWYPPSRRPRIPGTPDIWTSDRHTGVLTNTWIPNRYEHEEEIPYEPSCSNSWTIKDTTILMTPWGH